MDKGDYSVSIKISKTPELSENNAIKNDWEILLQWKKKTLERGFTRRELEKLLDEVFRLHNQTWNINFYL